jgi:hypothetical protein
MMLRMHALKPARLLACTDMAAAACTRGVADGARIENVAHAPMRAYRRRLNDRQTGEREFSADRGSAGTHPGFAGPVGATLDPVGATLDVSFAGGRVVGMRTPIQGLIFHNSRFGRSARIIDSVIKQGPLP